MSTSALHAEWKVATVNITHLFDQMPEVIALRAELEVKKQSLKDSARLKYVEELREELKQLNIEGSKVLLAYQYLKVKDEKGPEADRVREYRAKRQQAETNLQNAKEDSEQFELKELTTINQKMTERYRGILNRLTAEVQKQATAQGFDIVYDISGNTHVGLPAILYIKPGTYTDLTDDFKKMIADGKLK